MAWIPLTDFKFWCQQVLPTVYDDSLSYYEVLNKVVKYLNDVIDDVNILYSEYGSLPDAVKDLYEKFYTLKSTVNASLVALNERCTNLEDKEESDFNALKLYVDAIDAGLRETLSVYEAEFNAVRGIAESAIAHSDARDVITLRTSKSYTDSEIKKLKDWIRQPRNWFVVSPMTGQVEDIQTVIDELFSIISWGAFTCSEFDLQGFTCEYLDGLGYTCFDFDYFSRYMLLFSNNYVTPDMIADFIKREELEHYALKTDLEPYALKRDLVVYNPISGLKGTMQQAIDALIALHACGNNCFTLDGLDYTASEYDAIGFTAYEFDFEGIVKTCGYYISPVSGVKKPLQEILGELAGLHQHGLTATQLDALDADCDTIDAIEYTAFEFDYYGLSIFSQANLISVTTGITADQWSQLYVDETGNVVLIGT